MSSAGPAPLATPISARAPVIPPRAPSFGRRLLSRPGLLVGLALLALAVAVALLAPAIAPYDPLATNLVRPRSAPTPEHLLGADSLGRDVLSRLTFAARASLTVGLASVALNTLLGGAIGAVAGYFGRVWDMVLMRLTDVVLAFPLFVVAVAVVAVLSPSLLNVVLVLGLLGWPTVARLVRSGVLAVRSLEYVEAAQALGATDARILLRHILPNVLGPITVAATFGVARAILLEASLSFLGLGVQPPTPSWGNMLAEAQSLTTLEAMPYLWVPPGLAIALLVSAVNLVGSGLRDLLDPTRTKA
ncbi:MAG: ABC transporter permease [Chloroflexi bacterium]|nr:ABC transporter permease [Chloroflexota bacterium]